MRYFGGEWGQALQTVVLAAGALGFLASIASGSVRAWLRVFINKHFFSLRYDYRAEWLKLADTLYSASSVDALRQASIRVMADLVESPGGMLWLRSEAGHYAPAARLNVPMIDAREPADSPLIGRFRTEHARALIRLGRAAEAEPGLREAANALLAAGPAERTYAAKALLLLSECYTSLGRADQASHAADQARALEQPRSSSPASPASPALGEY